MQDDAAIVALIEIKQLLGGLIQQPRVFPKAPKQRSSAVDDRGIIAVRKPAGDRSDSR